MNLGRPTPPPAAPVGRVEKAGFRSDLEGLRAIAVTLVLLYHAAVPGFGGGYVGVDVFFVLSGFLISGLLLRELEATGTISLPSFYARRLRRLLPAVALLILVTVIASVVVLSPLRAGDVAADGVAASLYASNLRFAFQATDYLQAELAPSPLLHLWSLGVEEQFYLFWPALLLLAARTGSNRVRWVGILAGSVVVASFALSLWLTSASAPWAFFSLPSRAWELGIGALLAVGAARLAALPKALSAGAGWLGAGHGRRSRPDHRHEHPLPRGGGPAADRRDGVGDASRDAAIGEVRRHSSAGSRPASWAASRTRSTSGTGPCSCCRPRWLERPCRSRFGSR